MEQKTGHNRRMDARCLADFLSWSHRWIESDVMAWENERKEETRIV